MHQYCDRHEILFITQDHGLATDVLNLNTRKSVKAKTICVQKIKSNGSLEGFGAQNFNLESFIKIGTSRIFIDTCSVLVSGFEKFCQQIIPLLSKHSAYQRIVSLEPLFKELKKCLKRAHANKDTFEQLRVQGLAELLGDKNDSSVNKTLLIHFKKLMVSYPLFFISNHDRLPQELSSLNRRKKQADHAIQFAKIDKDGS
ncbi:hypothetical protein, partial [Helicobacter sp. L8]|uniref:hypothetical protein n=1 Tax=Helicobacter sp. L8 TaxID=2316078 RepID=UPI0013CDFA76